MKEKINWAYLVRGIIACIITDLVGLAMFVAGFDLTAWLWGYIGVSFLAALPLLVPLWGLRVLFRLTSFGYTER